MPQPHRDELKKAINRLVKSFQTVLYEKDEAFLKNMQTRNLAGDDVTRYQFWEWTQGVGLYGIWRLFEKTKDFTYLNILTTYYNTQIAAGLPGKNINTMAPVLTLSYLYEYTGNETYGKVCHEWTRWVVESLPRTEEGGFQHITSDSENDQELWDDTLFMAVLLVANMGRIAGNQAWQSEAQYQFLLHTQYLASKKNGLWYHGFTFHGRHNFARAFWARGNCWVTISIPLLLEMLPLSHALQRFFTNVLKQQAKTLCALQTPEGMWHTLLDDPSSYVEASATAGFGYGLLKAVHTGLLGEEYLLCAEKALTAVLARIDEQGNVADVSYGTPMGRENKGFYKTIPLQQMPYGQALAILLLMEALDA